MSAQLYTLHNQKFYRPTDCRRFAFWLEPFDKCELVGPRGKLGFMYYTRPVDGQLALVPKFITPCGMQPFTRDWPKDGFVDLTAETGLMLGLQGIKWSEPNPFSDATVERILIELITVH